MSQIDSGIVWIQGLALALVAIGMTLLVSGTVAVLVKADDVGLHPSRTGHFAPTRAVGRDIVQSMPGVTPGVGTRAFTAALDGLVGLAAGLGLVPVTLHALLPASGWFFRRRREFAA